MDLTRYPESVRKCEETYVQATARNDAKAASRAMRKMLTIAKELNDDALCGYACSELAHTAYFHTGDYKTFMKHLRLAGEYTLRSNERGPLKNTYYLVSLDATNRGMYDIAYSYAIAARDIAKAAGDEGDAGRIEEAAGFILLNMGQYEQAKKITHDALKRIAKDRNDSYYHSNMMCGFHNEGTACLMMNKIAQARKLYERAQRFAARHKAHVYTDNLFELARFGAHLALLEHDTKRMKRCMEQMERYIINVPQLPDEMQDIVRFGNALAAQKKYTALKELLRILSKKELPKNAINAGKLLADLKVTYYTAVKDARRLNAAYREQDVMYERAEEERRDSYTYVQGLIRLTEQLKKERDAVRSEHEALLKKAHTDALTGLNNRHALNRHLEETFEEAFAKKETIGVVLIDVDGLKHYNDTYGHAAGDRCLVEIGQELLDLSRRKDAFVARYGGDEFVIVFKGKSNEEIFDSLQALQDAANLSLSQGVCNGVPAKKNRIWDYLAGADDALYRLKRSKETGNRIRFTNA